MSQPPELPNLFCTSQTLSLLGPVPPGLTVRECLSGDRFWDERHAGRGGGKATSAIPWQPVQRDDLVTELTAKGGIKRLAIVCAGGYGKSTNLAWLSAMLARAGQVPFLFPLDDERLPRTSAEFWNELVFDEFGGQQLVTDAKGKDRLLATLRRARETGRVTLLLDSIDQATRDGRTLLRSLLRDLPPDCPLVVTGRPHAVYEHWDTLFAPVESAWRFLRVEPLAMSEQILLLGSNAHTADVRPDVEERRQKGGQVYDRLPPSGRGLMRNPRHVEYVRLTEQRQGRPREGGAVVEPARLEEYTLEDLRTASHLFAGAVDHAVRRGLKAVKARYLGKKRNEATVEGRADFATDLLAALAYAMYARLDEGPLSPDQKCTPNVSVVPRKRLGALRKAVVKLLNEANLVEAGYTATDLEDHDLPALDAMNAFIMYDLVDKGLDLATDFRWHDGTLQEFLAAWWLSRYADATDIERLRSWRYDNRMEPEKSLYAPLWRFLVEMPQAVRTGKWFDAVYLLFEPIKEGEVVRCCEMICRSWPTLEQSVRGRAIIAAWQQEFVDLREKDTSPRGEFARGLWSSRKRCPAHPAEDGQSFLMGSPERERNRSFRESQHSMVVTPFCMSWGPVTNAEYELFDPGHEQERRWGGGDPNIARHPVVYVDWWEAWCFSRWAGGRLPTEAEWEYACRGGTETPFYWGDTLNGTEANCNGDYPYGTDQKGDYKKRTTAVGEYEAKAPKSHPWGLVDVHGNVREWCQDFYDEDFYERPEALGPDPECGSGEQTYRVLRGGSWRDARAWYCRAAYRSGQDPEFRGSICGFRVLFCLG